MKELTNEEVNNLRGALLDAFPDQKKLAEMVYFRLGENLSVITEGGDLGDIVFALLIWAKSEGKMEELIKGALAQKPISRCAIHKTVKLH